MSEEAANILVVDDLDIDREMVRRCLSAFENLKFSFASDGEEALQMVEERPPELVVTDLRMPGMDGLELVRRMSQDFPLIPVILMTSQGSEQIAVQALKAGAAHYVSKDELKETLAETICEVLEIVRARRKRSKVLEYFESSETRFRIPSDVSVVTPMVAFFQELLSRRGIHDEALRMHVGIALMEALSNAIIHGNLEVESELRRTNREAFDKRVEERSKKPEYRSREVLCTSIEYPDSIKYIIQDEGCGFDPGEIPDPTDPENLLLMGGRGIMLIRTLMDRVEFNEQGNQITLYKELPGAG